MDPPSYGKRVGSYRVLNIVGRRVLRISKIFVNHNFRLEAYNARAKLKTFFQKQLLR